MYCEQYLPAGVCLFLTNKVDSGQWNLKLEYPHTNGLGIISVLRHIDLTHSFIFGDQSSERERERERNRENSELK